MLLCLHTSSSTLLSYEEILRVNFGIFLTL
jgi:hypothetical protein